MGSNCLVPGFMLLFWQSKYIEALKEQAEQSKREQDIVYERKHHKERSKEKRIG